MDSDTVAEQPQPRFCPPAYSLTQSLPRRTGLAFHKRARGPYSAALDYKLVLKRGGIVIRPISQRCCLGAEIDDLRDGRPGRFGQT